MHLWYSETQWVQCLFINSTGKPLPLEYLHLQITLRLKFFTSFLWGISLKIQRQGDFMIRCSQVTQVYISEHQGFSSWVFGWEVHFGITQTQSFAVQTNRLISEKTIKNKWQISKNYCLQLAYHIRPRNRMRRFLTGKVPHSQQKTWSLSSPAVKPSLSRAEEMTWHFLFLSEVAEVTDHSTGCLSFPTHAGKVSSLLVSCQSSFVEVRNTSSQRRIFFCFLDVVESHIDFSPSIRRW